MREHARHDTADFDHAEAQIDHAERRKRVLESIGADGVALIAATPERNRNNDVDYPYRPNSDFRYLTGFVEPQAIAVLAPGFEQGEYLLFCRERDPEQETWIGHRAGTEGAKRDFHADDAFVIDEFDAWLGRLLDGRKRVFTTLGVHPDFENRVLRRLEDLRSQGRRSSPPEEIVNLSKVVHEMRLHKSEAEIALMQRAAATSARAHRAAMTAAAPGVWEYQLAAALHYQFELDGMHWAYPSIVGSGANACVLHYIENAGQLAENDLVLIDAGAEYRGYAGDITRTFPANGRFSAAQRELYDVVLAANEAGIDAVRVGQPAEAPHRAARDVLIDGMIDLGLLAGERDAIIEAESYKTYFMHGTSHFLGMDVHDVGNYKHDGEWRDLAPGMVLTVEPGLYVRPDDENAPARFRGIGIRIEDDVVVSAAGPRIMTGDVPKQAVDIEALMATTGAPDAP